jgi:hypothetical protein
VEELPCEEFDNILLFFRYKAEQEEKALKSSKGKKR